MSDSMRRVFPAPTRILRRGTEAAVVGAASVAAFLSFVAPAAAEILTTHCGTPIRSVTRTMVNDDFSVPNGTYVDVPHALYVIAVPAGQTQCVRLRFSVTSKCTTAMANQNCFIRVREDGAAFPLDPAIAIGEPELAAHSFEWAMRLSAGSHTLRFQASGNAGGPLVIANWTYTVEIAK